MDNLITKIISHCHCKNCGEKLEGDGYTVALHCPNYEGELFEPDSPITFCDGGDDDE